MFPYCYYDCILSAPTDSLKYSDSAYLGPYVFCRFHFLIFYFPVEVLLFADEQFDILIHCLIQYFTARIYNIRLPLDRIINFFPHNGISNKK